MPDERRATFDTFVRESSGPLFGQAYLVVGEYHEAQDLVQETLVRVWQHWSRVSGYEEPRAWARHVLHNLAVSRWRRMRVRATVAEVERSTPPPDIGHLDLFDALRRLPVRQRSAIVLHDVEGLSVSEVASELKVPEGSVRGWLSRGRASLAADLASGETEVAPG
jgi:RNA polymerase sigma-70 factor, ECF subfamily